MCCFMFQTIDAAFEPECSDTKKCPANKYCRHFECFDCHHKHHECVAHEQCCDGMPCIYGRCDVKGKSSPGMYLHACIIIHRLKYRLLTGFTVLCVMILSLIQMGGNLPNMTGFPKFPKTDFKFFYFSKVLSELLKKYFGVGHSLSHGIPGF